MILWETLSETITNADGRGIGLATFGPGVESSIHAGIFKLVFETEAYFATTSTTTFYPRVEVVFKVTDVQAHYHVPLLLSPFGYSTYRGS